MADFPAGDGGLRGVGRTCRPHHFAGAFGNLIDRVIYAEGFLNGKVVDFLNYGWSIGNVADIFLMLAGVAAVLLLFLGEPFSQKDLDEANGKTLGDDANATDDGAKAA